MFGDEPYKAAFKAAAEATRARIRRDRARAPKVLKKVFTVVANRLFDPTLTAAETWKAAGIRDRAMGTRFMNSADTTLGRYIAAARIEVAHVLMMLTDLPLTTISERVGFTYHPTFSENYKRMKETLPSDVPRELLTPPLLDDETALKASRNLLDGPEMAQHIQDLLQVCPEAKEHLQLAADNCPEPLIVVDGAADDELRAKGIWQGIHDLPFAEQRQQVRRYSFRSTVLFDLLREMSRLEGRKSRRRGVEVAELALASLERSDEVFGDRIHDLRAFGWAWLGDANQLALDFSAAASAFEQADRAWSIPRAQPDQLVLANICGLKGMMWMVRREYVEATECLDRSCSLFQQLNEARNEALALIKRAAIHIYAGKLSQAVEDLGEAAGLIDEDEEKELAFAIRGNLALALVRIGNTKSAGTELDRARQLNCVIDVPLGTAKLDWIDGDLGAERGDLETAKRFYQSARTGFCAADARRYFGMVSVDLMIIHSAQDEWKRVGELAAKTLPILGSLSLHNETLVTVKTLVQAVEAGNLSLCLLNELRDALRQDPLAM